MGYHMKTIYILLLALPTLLACVAEPLSPEENEALQLLAWIDNNTPEEAAAQALANGDTRLAGFARRGASLPGIEAAKSAQYQNACGTKLLPGTGDTIYGEQQLKRLKQAQRYAERYNQYIAKRCLASNE